ncbi:hypothetical protein [Streptomyces sp. XH2]|uniref:hypothetical protein n=1 Tax=Streptomyces sp. XH2 TaxID=3412483 RepID=UPI003C7C0577
MEPVAGSAPYPSHTPADCGCGCDRGEVRAAETDSVHEDGGCKPAISSYAYVLGQIDFRFPSLSIEKELAQNVGQAEVSQLTDRQAVRQVISQPENRYLARRRRSDGSASPTTQPPRNSARPSTPSPTTNAHTPWRTYRG